MTWRGEFVRLDKTIHDRSSFDCGEVELHGFIRNHAARHMVAGISTTMLLPAAKPMPSGKFSICAFYTIAPGAIAKESLPAARARKLPHYPVPVFLLAQMAVHQEYHGQGLGQITLVKALEYLVEINAHMRAYAIIVDCLNEAVQRFYAKYGFEFLSAYNGRVRMFLPMKTAEQLFR